MSITLELMRLAAKEGDKYIPTPETFEYWADELEAAEKRIAKLEVENAAWRERFPEFAPEPKP